MRIDVHLTESARVEADVRGHRIVTDQPERAGGENAAPAPFELFLASIAIMPSLLIGNLHVDPMVAYFLGGTSVLIVVGVALDMVDRINAQLMMRNYEGFMKSGGSGWTRKKA